MPELVRIEPIIDKFMMLPCPVPPTGNVYEYLKC